MLSDELLQILACPKCRGNLTYRPESAQLLCPSCRLAYAIEDDIPVLLIDSARPLP